MACPRAPYSGLARQPSLQGRTVGAAPVPTTGKRPAPGSGNLAAISVHESRIIRFDGMLTDVLSRQKLAGWTYSVLQPVYDTLRRFNLSFDSTVNLLADAQQAVFKIKGLEEKLSFNEAQLHARMQLVDLMRSTARAVMIDAEGEEFKREPTSFAGMADVLDRVMLLVSADADMPLTELFGRSPAGLNATGESDTRKWYDTIATEQSGELEPKVQRVYKVLAKARVSGISSGR